MPGHEKFIKNSVSRYKQYRCSLLGIAVNKKKRMKYIMPQTREHVVKSFQLLDVKKGIIALTKQI